MISYVTRFIDLSDKPFILHPHPQEDELLSSWLVRISLAHDTMPCSFTNMHFPEYKNIIHLDLINIFHILRLERIRCMDKNIVLSPCR